MVQQQEDLTLDKYSFYTSNIVTIYYVCIIEFELFDLLDWERYSRRPKSQKKWKRFSHTIWVLEIKQFIINNQI